MGRFPRHVCGNRHAKGKACPNAQSNPTVTAKVAKLMNGNRNRPVVSNNKNFTYAFVRN